MTWWAIATLAAGTYAMKAVGPVVIGRRTIPVRLQRMFLLVAAALLAALVALSTFVDGTYADGARVVIDWPLVVGVGAAGLAILRRAPLVVVIGVAALVAALMRLAS